MTSAEKIEIKDLILQEIRNESTDITEIDEATSLDGINSLPAMNGTNLVSVPLSILKKGTDAEVSIDEIDFDRSKCAELVKLNTTTYYNVYTMLSGNKVSVGTMMCFSDDMTHVLTQVLFSHFPDPNGGSHKDAEIYVHYRSFNYKRSTLDIPAYTWTEWKLLTSSEFNARFVGEASDSSADTDPFIVLGRFSKGESETTQAFYDRVNAAIDGTFSQDAGSENKKYCGDMRVFTSGVRTNIHQYVINYDAGKYVQVADGPIDVDANGKLLFSRDKYKVFSRLIEGGVAGSWAEFGVHKLQYESASRKLIMKSYENEVISEVTLPEATRQNAGLMTGAHLTRLNNTLSSNVGAFDADISATTKNNPVTAKMVGTTVTGGDIVFAWYKLEGMPLTMAGFLYRVGLQYYNVSPDAAKPIPDKNGLLTNRDKTAAYLCVNDELVKVLDISTKQDVLTTSEDLNISSENVLSLTDAAKMKLFIDMWDVMVGNAGGYNTTTAYFELNGLSDITYGQAKIIYNSYYQTYTKDADYNFSYKSIRTNPPIKYYKSGATTTAVATFLNCGNMEIFDNFSIIGPGFGDIKLMFYACKNLHTINGLLLSPSYKQITSNAFKMCEKLKNVQIKNLNADIVFADSPLLSIESLTYIVQNAANTTPITITLHPDVYAQCTDELLAAATAKNIIISTTA